jgi:hypothetical protein
MEPRQWTVLIASTSMLMVAWAVTPLQNGIFNTSVTTVNTPVKVQTASSLIPVDKQGNELSADFLMAGYGISWLGQQPPAFTTKEYALAPFQSWHSETGAIPATSNQTITSQTTLYDTSLDCAPPSDIFVPKVGAGVYFDDGKGCRTSYGILQFPEPLLRNPDAQWQPYYVGYWYDSRTTHSLQGAECPLSTQHSFLAVWTRKDGDKTPDFHDPTQTTAWFCTPSYHTQQVNATIRLSDLSVMSTTPIGPRSPMPADIFNVTLFEYVLGVGVPPNIYGGAPQMDPPYLEDISDIMPVHHDGELTNLSIGIPNSNMVGYAVGLSDRSMEKFLDPEELHLRFERAHKLLFALAVHKLMPVGGSSDQAVGVVQSVFQTVRLVPKFALLAQAFLFLVLISTCFLLVKAPRRRNHLVSDPDSMAQIMTMSDDDKLQQLLCRYDNADDKSLYSALEAKHFRLEPGNFEIPPRITITDYAEGEKDRSDTQLSMPHHLKKSVRPLEFSWFIGGPFIVFLIGTIAVLYVVRQEGLVKNGTTPLSGRFLGACLPF